MLDIKEVEKIRDQYFSATNKAEKKLAIEAMALLVKDNVSNPKSFQKQFLKSYNASNISMNDIYGEDGIYPDMKIMKTLLFACHVAYHNGKPSKEAHQRGLINGKMEDAHAEKILNMTEHPESYKYGNLIGSFDLDTGCISIQEGASRLISLLIRGKSDQVLLGVFVNLPEHLKRDIFLTQGNNRRSIKALDHFFVAAGSDIKKDAPYKMLHTIGSKHGITFFPDYNLVHNCTSVNCLVNCAKHYHEEGVEWVFNIIEDAGYEPYLHTYRQHFLTTMVYAYSMLQNAKVANPREVLLKDLIKKGDPDTFEEMARPTPRPEFTTKGRNGEGPMKAYILKLFKIH